MSAALVLAIASAVLFGSSDFCAARSARTTASLAVTRTAVLASVVLSPVLFLVVDFKWSSHDAVIAALSGIAMISGLMLLYHGYAVARMGVVAPLSSVVLATVPVVWDLLMGHTPSALASTGMALGVCAVALTSFTPGGRGSATLGAVLGLGSGFGFGVAFTLMGEVHKSSGLWPVMVQRGAGLCLLFALVPFRSEAALAKERGALWGVAAGTLGLLAIASLQLAFQRGDLGPVSVASSQFGTVAVLLSIAFNRERMRWWQAMGVGTTAVAVALIAAGG